MIQIAWLIPLFPTMAALVNGLFGRKYMKHHISDYIATGAVMASFLIALVVFFEVAAGSRLNVNYWDWVVSGDFGVSFGFLIDPLTAVMLVVVTGISSLVHLYSIGYMHDDDGYYRFFTYLSMFTVSMLILVMGNNYLLMFLGWEGVGLCSYLLIGFWFEKKSAGDASKKAFVTNRVGDLGFVLGLFLIISQLGTLDYVKVFQSAPMHLTTGVVTAITLLLFIGATAKSAQIPLYTWLPDAMEGPTPVSALIHAATMVTAGVYMVARSNVLYSMAPVTMDVIATIGAITALFAATIATAQNDIKRIVAYSTVSQLGYMFMALGLGAYTAGIYHLFTHAFFKACLFLGAGSVIHALSGEQDIRKMGGLFPHIKITSTTFLIAALANAGIFPFAGFFSKDEILWAAFSGDHYLLWGIGATAAFCSSFYMFRLFFLTFTGESRVDEHTAHHIHESPKVMTIPLIILAFMAATVGALALPPGNGFIHHFLGPVFGGHGEAELKGVAAELFHKFAALVTGEPTAHGHLLEYFMMLVSLGIALSGIALAYLMYYRKVEALNPEVLSQRFRLIYQAFYNKYWVDELYDFLFVNPTKKAGERFWSFDGNVVDGAVNGASRITLIKAEISNFLDKYVVDGTVNGLAFFVDVKSRVLRRAQTGDVQNYALVMLLGVVFVMGVYYFY